MCVKSLQSCPTLCDPMDCSPPGSSVHGILQARLLEWVAIPFCRGSSPPSQQLNPSVLHWQADSLLSEPPGRSFPDNGSVVEPSTEPACQGRRCRFDPWMRKIPGRRKWLPTPVFLPGEFHGQRSLVGCNPWGPKESDITKRLNTPSLPICSEGQK